MPSHQVTLRRVFANAAALCLFLIVVVSLPDATRRDFTFAALLFAPTIIVLSFAVYLSSRMLRTLGYVTAGAAVGWVLAPRMLVNPPPQSAWDRFVLDFMTIGLSTASVAMFTAVVDWFLTTRKRRPAMLPTETHSSMLAGASPENPYVSPAEYGESSEQDVAGRQSLRDFFMQCSFLGIFPAVMLVFWLMRDNLWTSNPLTFYTVNGLAILFTGYKCLQMLKQGKQEIAFIGFVSLVVFLILSSLPIWHSHAALAPWGLDQHRHHYWDMFHVH